MSERKINFLFVISKLSLFLIFGLSLVSICVSLLGAPHTTPMNIAQYVLCIVGFLLIAKLVPIPGIVHIIFFLTLVQLLSLFCVLEIVVL